MKTNNVQIIELNKEAIKKITALDLQFRFRQNMNRIKSHYGF